MHSRLFPPHQLHEVLFQCSAVYADIQNSHTLAFIVLQQGEQGVRNVGGLITPVPLAGCDRNGIAAAGLLGQLCGAP